MDKNTQTKDQTQTNDMETRDKILELGYKNIEKSLIKHDRPSLMKKYGSKSAAVRFLDSEGFKRSEILIFMNTNIGSEKKMIYQHVRNILVTLIKKK